MPWETAPAATFVSGLVVADEATLVTLGDLTTSSTLLVSFGIVVTAAFIVNKVKGGVVYGIVATGIALGLVLFPLFMVFRGREVHPVMYVLFAVFLADFVWGV